MADVIQPTGIEPSEDFGSPYIKLVIQPPIGISVARVGDRTYGFCRFAWRYHHRTYWCGNWGGTIIGHSNTVKANGLEVARVGDLIQHDPNPSAPGHDQMALITTGSPSVNADGKPIAREGDACQGTWYSANIVAPCSPNVNVE